MTGPRLRLLFLADAVFEDLPGGSRVVARELAQGLADRGHEVTFLVARQATGTPDNVRSGAIRVVRYDGAGRGRAFVRAGRLACAQLWAEQPFDVVHTHFAYAALGPLQAIPRCVPHVRTFHGPWDTEGWVEDCARLAAGRGRHPARHLTQVLRARGVRWLRHRIEGLNLRRSQSVTVLSKGMQTEVLSHGYPPARIRVIPGGTDTARFVPTDNKAAVRQVLGLPAERRLLLSVRRLAPRMGLDRLIEAMPEVVKHHPDVLLLIGGRGPERERLAGLIAAHDLRDHVRLLGFISDSDLASYYQAADLFVLPTLALEGFGLVTTEALACGVPVLGTPIGATPELLAGLDRQLIAPGVDKASLAAGIRGFLEGDWSTALTPDRLHRYVADRYTWDRHVDAIERLYREVIPQDARRHQLASE